MMYKRVFIITILKCSLTRNEEKFTAAVRPDAERQLHEAECVVMFMHHCLRITSLSNLH